MSKLFNDPSLLTKERLKRELKSNGVELPRSEQPKSFYVQLYKEHLSPGRVGNGEFSSDDDGYEEAPQSKQIVSRSSRSIKKVGSKDIVSDDIKSLSDGDLKDELAQLGQSIGPITPTTRTLYERKLARLRTSPGTENNGEAVTTLSKPEFSDNDFEEETVHEEQAVPEDEFFYKNSRRSGNSFGSTFTKNFQNTSVQKEVRHDVSVSRNVERSSTVDHKTTNKVRQKKGDKFEEKSWSSDSQNDADNFDQEDSMHSLPASVQRALTSAQRLTPEKKQEPQLRGRSWRPNTTQRNIEERAKEEPKQEPQETSGKSKRWWIIVLILLVLIALTIAVVLNLERLPEIKSYLSGDNEKQALPDTV